MSAVATEIELFYPEQIRFADIQGACSSLCFLVNVECWKEESTQDRITKEILISPISLPEFRFKIIGKHEFKRTVSKG
jgi:hypothetical protein